MSTLELTAADGWVTGVSPTLDPLPDGGAGLPGAADPQHPSELRGVTNVMAYRAEPLDLRVNSRSRDFR